MLCLLVGLACLTKTKIFWNIHYKTDIVRCLNKNASALRATSSKFSLGRIGLHVCWTALFYLIYQRCGLGLDVSVSRRSRDLSKVSSRAYRQTSRSRELRSRSWPRSRQFRSRAQVPANHIFWFGSLKCMT